MRSPCKPGELVRVRYDGRVWYLQRRALIGDARFADKLAPQRLALRPHDGDTTFYQWNTVSFMAEERVKRKLAAILAADVVGYSRLMGADEAGTLSSF